MKKENLKYRGGKLSEIVLASLRPFIEKIKVCGIKKSIENLLPGINADEFVLSKIKSQLCKKRGVELGKGLGRADIQYRFDGIQIEFVGAIRLLIKKITITDEQILCSFDDILNQIEQKYIIDDSYITKKTDDIICSLSGTEIYKPRTSEEKTLYDLAMLILLNYYKSSNEIPHWIEPAIVNIGKGEFIKKWIEILADYIAEVVAQVSEDIFFDFKFTLDSFAVRTFLNKKTNKGQISRLLGMFDINIKKIIYKFTKSYVSPSFIHGASEIFSNVAGTLLSDFPKANSKQWQNLCNDNEFCDGVFNITVTFGENPFSQRRFRWFTKSSCTESVFEYSYDPNFKTSQKIIVSGKKVPKAVPVLNLGLIASYKIVSFSKYSLKVDALSPGTLYYRITAGHVVSKTYHMKITHPSKESKFVIFADSQGMVKSDYELFAKVMEGALKKEKTCDFIVHVGDFVDDGNNEEYWKWVLENNSWCENPAVVLSGNHEARVSAVTVKAGVENAVLGHFNLTGLPPQNFARDAYYSFVYNNMTFIVIGTNTDSEEGLGKVQFGWALETAKNAKTKWKILLTHKSPYSNGPHHKDPDVKKIGKQIVDLAYMAKIDLVIGGHDHVYARTPFLTENVVTGGAPCSKIYRGEKYESFIDPIGTAFVVPGTSGVKNYLQHFPTDFVSRKLLDLNSPVYSTVEANETTLYFNAYKFSEKNSSFSKIDSFAIEKSKEAQKTFYAADAEKYICAIPDIPCIDNTDFINKAFEVYSSLEYQEKINVKNYCDLLSADRMNKSFLGIKSAQIRVVRNKKEFMQAIKDQRVGTIVTQCSEIKFENKLSFHSRVIINRDLCITGEAKLSCIKFILKENAFLIVSGNVCIDNTRRPTSLYPARSAAVMYDYSVFVLNDNATLNGRYGIGRQGVGINALGENCRIYLGSSGHNLVSNGVVFAAKPSSKVTVCSGKYLSLGGSCAVAVSGKLIVNGGFVRSIKGFEDSAVIVSGGIIGEENKLQFPVALQIHGKFKVTGGTIKSRNGISAIIYNSRKADTVILKSQVDMKGKILYN